MNKMFEKINLGIGVLVTNEILKTKNSPKTLLAPQRKAINIYKIPNLLQNQRN